MLGRVLALALKDLAGLWKDRKTRMVLLIPPLLQVLIFAYAATYDVTNVPLGIWNEDAGIRGDALVRRFAGSPAFRIAALVQSPAQAQAAIDSKRVAAVLHVPQRFSADLAAGRTTRPQLLIDTRRSNTALLIQGYATEITDAFALQYGPVHRQPVVLMDRYWFNPNLSSQWFILPGLVAVLSMMMAMLVSALSLARERELGTFEQLLVTPLRPVEILLGKALPGAIVGLLNANIVILAAVLWFRVPLRGNVAVLEAILAVYMLAAVGLGLMISSISHTQQQSMLGMFTLASPLVVLSGYAAPVENMPPFVEIVSRADPMRWMLMISRGIFLQMMPADFALHLAIPVLGIGLVAFTGAWFAVGRAVG